MTNQNRPAAMSQDDYDEQVDLVEFHFTWPEPSRRDFLGVLGAGLVIAVTAGSARSQDPKGGRRGGAGRGPSTLAARLHIGQDGTLTVMTGKVECGQGARAELTQAAAEELRVPAGAVRLVMADTSLVPDGGGTFGSRSTPSTVPSIRKGCAAARDLLARTAARRWGVDPKKIVVRDGKASDGGERSFSYGDLASDADAAKAFGAAPADVDLTPIGEWKVLGTSVPRPNGRDIVTGSHAYPSDITRPGMLHGKVLRRPSNGAKLLDVNLGKAQAMDGVIVVRDGDFVGVAAPSKLAAGKALDSIAETARWEDAPHPSSGELSNYLRDHARGGVPANPFADEVAKGAKTLKQTYDTVPRKSLPDG